MTLITGYRYSVFAELGELFVTVIYSVRFVLAPGARSSILKLNMVFVPVPETNTIVLGAVVVEYVHDVPNPAVETCTFVPGVNQEGIVAKGLPLLSTTARPRAN